VIEFFAIARSWDHRLALTVERTAQAQVMQVRGGPESAVTLMTKSGPECLAALRELAYPDARNIPKDPDAARAYAESQRRSRWWADWHR
jgi:hypothetical protein